MVTEDHDPLSEAILAIDEMMMQHGGVMPTVVTRQYRSLSGDRGKVRRAREQIGSHGCYDRVREKIIFDPMSMPVPQGTGDEVAMLKLEDRLWQTDAGHTVVGLGSIHLVEIYRLCSYLYARHPIAKNIINNYTFLTIGENVKVTWLRRGGRRRSVDASEEEWKAIARETGFHRYVRRMVRMMFLLGEWFTATLPERKTSKAKKTALRGIEPDRVPTIFLDSEDHENVVGYEYVQSDGSRVMLSSEDVVHARVGELGNVVRGIPVLLPVLSPLRSISLFVEDRSWLHRMRARLPVVRKVKGSAVQVQAEKSRLDNMTLPPPMTIAIDSDAHSWDFPSLNLGAADAKDDGLMLAMLIASGVGLPLALVLNDASQNTYASGVLLESPMVKQFLDYQDLVRGYLEELVSELTGADPGVDFQIEFPPIVKRDIAQTAAAAAVLVDRKIWSRRTAAEFTGRPWGGADGEEARIAAEPDTLSALMSMSPTPMAPDAKKVDGGPGEPKAGVAQGAGASPRSRPRGPDEARS